MDRKFLLLLIQFAIVNKSGCHPRTKSGKSASECSYQYVVQPWQNTVLAQCNPLGVSVTLACTVQGTGSSFGIIWQRAGLSSPDLIGTSASQNSFSIRSNSRYTANIVPDADTNRISSRLTIANFQVADYGYYWCMVASGSTIYPTPSKVVRIAEPCNAEVLPQCNASVSLYSATARNDQVCAEERDGPVSIPSAPNCAPPIPEPRQIVSQAIRMASETTRQSPASSLVPQSHVSPSEVPTRVPYTSGPLPTSVPYTSGPWPSSTVRPGLESSTSEDEQGIERYTWLFIGLVAAVLLVIIGVLFTLIVCVECKKRRTVLVHDTIHATDVESPEGELMENGREPTTQEEGQQETKDQTVTSKAHDYTEISNFLDERNIGVYQNVQESQSTRPGHYDDVLPDLSRSTRRHSYDRVIDDGSLGYHRLQHQGSVHSRASQQSSLKLQASRQSSDAADLTSPPPQPESTAARTLESSHHQIDIYQEELGSQTSEEDYHHLDRPSTKPSLKQPALQVSHDTGPHYSQLSCTAVPLGEGAPPQQVGGEHQLPEVSQYESLYRGLVQVQESQFGENGPGNAPDHSKHTDELPDALEPTRGTTPPEFESLYSPLSEFGVVIGEADEGCDAETETLPGSAQKDEYPQAEMVNPWVTSKVAEGVVIGSTSGHTTEVPLSPNTEPLDDYSTTLSGGGGYYHQLEPPGTNSEEERLSNGDGGGIGPDTQQPGSRAFDRRSDGYSHLELEYPVHNYTSIIPSERNSQNQYNVPIISSTEVYRSEHDHVYHVLESS